MVIDTLSYLMKAKYYAPRGKRRLLNLGVHLSQRYLCPDDKLIGLVGSAGAGKSLLIRGMFPGLELTNDDHGINVRPLPLLHDADAGFFKHQTYHVDVRFESAFCQIWELVEAVKKALAADRRLVIEHFELLYPSLNINAEMLIGIGEKVTVVRPNVFGPEPEEIATTAFETLKYRLMSHTAEDLTTMTMRDIGLKLPEVHSDVKHGFVLNFRDIPNIDLEKIEAGVKKLIAEDLPVCYVDDEHIKIGDRLCKCTAPRLHVNSTGEIKGFRLLKDYKWDSIHQLYMIAGLISYCD
ncbi:hypothetical protein GGQ84_002504 [Desulfitispora alkaliphila]|uniref:alanine-tRNA synthetase second additional domain-containing protein n=1 Tax=Desulfitispora alkaliphila TaxID=622674 RepID=UPI003D20433D